MCLMLSLLPPPPHFVTDSVRPMLSFVVNITWVTFEGARIPTISYVSCARMMLVNIPPLQCAIVLIFFSNYGYSFRRDFRSDCSNVISRFVLIYITTANDRRMSLPVNETSNICSVIGASLGVIGSFIVLLHIGNRFFRRHQTIRFSGIIASICIADIVSSTGPFFAWVLRDSSTEICYLDALVRQYCGLSAIFGAAVMCFTSSVGS